jgi:uncharacterized protein YcfL
MNQASIPFFSAVALALAAATLFGSCRGLSTVSPENSYTMGGAGTETSTMDSQLASQLEILNPRSRTQDDRMHVQFDLHNKRNTTLPMEWKLEWQDASGFKIDAPQHWRPLVLGGGAVETLAATAPTPQASIWKLRVRRRSAIR